MKKLEKTNYRVGLTGNHYVYGYEKEYVVEVALLIDEKEDIVYFNEKYSVYAFRIKDNTQKLKLKELYK